ncbi:hypothetical protein ACUN24_25095 [Pedobacter sp. WC2501]|nr:hypothetical protein [uncultured Pedobacter sp.]
MDVATGTSTLFLNLIEVVPILHRKERRAGVQLSKSAELLIS